MTIDYLHPQEKFLRTIDIKTLLPQQPPFVMVGKLTFFDARKTITETLVSAENIFTNAGTFSASGLIENIAQTCAARIGYVNQYVLQRGIQIGFMGAIRNLDIYRLPKVGERMTTIVEVMEEVFGMTLAKAQVVCDEEVLVTAEMKIAVKEEERK